MSQRSTFILLGVFTFLVTLSGIAFAQTPYTAARITQPIDETRLIRLRGNTHPLAQARFDRGPAQDDLPMQRMLLVLKHSPAQKSALETLLDQQTDRYSPNFHHWLTPAQFGEQFGPSDQDIQKITGWLVSHSFQVNRISKGRTAIEFNGTAGTVRTAFHTSVHQYVINGASYWANTSDPQIPEALAPVVAGFSSLNNFPMAPTIQIRKNRPAQPSAQAGAGETPDFTFNTTSACNDGTGICYGLGPWDFATIYNVLPAWNSGINGRGVTIGIVATSDINPQDAQNFRTLFGLPSGTPSIIYDGADPGKTSAEGEAIADVEWAGGVATGANIDLVVSGSTNGTSGVDLAAEYIVDNNLSDVVTASFSDCELFLGTSGNLFIYQLWQQAAAQGMSVVKGAEDAGSAACDNFNLAAPNPAQFGLQVNGLASTPYDLAVGGTDFNQSHSQSLYWNSSNSSTQHASAKSYIPEIPWNGTCTNPVYGTNLEADCNSPSLASHVKIHGTGGGQSRCIASDGSDVSSCIGGYAKPSWQTGLGVPNDGARDIPDVSLFAADGFFGSFYIVCEADADPDGSGAPCDLSSPYGHFVQAGGNSLSSQAFGGIMALVDQKAGGRQGNPNPVIYALGAQQSAADCNASGPAASCIFNDVTAGNNAMPCLPGSPDCVTSTQGDAYGVLSGYSANAGYDLATGWGSVNVANFVNASGWAPAPTAADFSLSSSGPVNITNTLNSPTTGTTTFTITSENGFTGTFPLSPSVCSALPTGATCSFSAPSLTVTPQNPTASATVTITMASAQGSNTGVFWDLRDWPTLGSVEMIVCTYALAFLLLAVLRGRRKALAIPAFALAILISGCGSGGSNSANSGGNGSGPPGPSLTAPQLTTNPTSQSAALGASATFAAAANGNPTPTVQWEVSSDGGNTFTNINGATSTQLQLSSIAASQNATVYKAVFANSQGTATSTAATLTVTPLPANTTSSAITLTSGGLTHSVVLTIDVP
ncbi:MAG TPA: S53 family peptidase [Candidatus Acidoferrales bacterium]